MIVAVDQRQQFARGRPAQARTFAPRDGVDELLGLIWRAEARGRTAVLTTLHGRPAMRRLRFALLASILTAALTAGWVAGLRLHEAVNRQQAQLADTVAVNRLVDRIIRAESGGDPNAKNKRSTASGAGQFLEGTWLDMIRAHRPDLAGRSEQEKLDLRFDPGTAREITQRFAERNAAYLAARGLPVTPGTLYLSHFAGGAGAAALLTAPEHVDAATVMAGADSTGKTTRDKIVKANPFLESFTVADIKSWGERKMRPPEAVAARAAGTDPGRAGK